MMEQKNRLLELDALRGLAALCVVVFHYTINENAVKLGWRFAFGVTGVDIFFIISGFVIFLTIQKIKKWQDFVVFRFARLYPTYWSCVLITAFFIWLFTPERFDTVQVLANLTMFPVYFGIEDLDGSYWTLLVELIFYLWILVVYLLHGIDRMLLIGFLCTVGILLFHLFGPYYPDFYRYITWKVQLLNHFPLFFSGILFYNLKFKPFAWRYAILILFSMLAAFYLHDKGGRTMHYLSALEHSLIIVFYHVVFCLFVYGKLAFLVQPWLVFLGKISYSLYLLHQFIGSYLLALLNETYGLNIYPAIILTILAMVGMAYLVTRFIETPAIRKIKGWYQAREGRKVEEAEAARTALP